MRLRRPRTRARTDRRTLLTTRGRPVTIIVGVGPREFNGEANALVTDFWLSISSSSVGGPYRAATLERRGDHWYQVKARLAPGVTIEQAQTAMRGLAARLAEAYPTARGSKSSAWSPT